MRICDLIECAYDIDILGITDDSRDVSDGFLFVATKGYNVDHFDYIGDAIKNGAVFIIADRRIDFQVIHRHFVDEVSFQVLYPCYNRQEIERKRHYRHPVLGYIHLELAFGHHQRLILLVQRNVLDILTLHVINKDGLGLPR